MYDQYEKESVIDMLLRKCWLFTFLSKLLHGEIIDGMLMVCKYTENS